MKRKLLASRDLDEVVDITRRAKDQTRQRKRNEVIDCDKTILTLSGAYVHFHPFPLECT